jgi:hypothetical protein
MQALLARYQNSVEIFSSGSDTKLTDGQPDNTAEAVFLDLRFYGVTVVCSTVGGQ